MIKKEQFEKLKLEKSDLEILDKVCEDGELKVFDLPDNNIAVPSFYVKSHENPLEYLHIRICTCVCVVLGVASPYTNKG